jgi:predicted deacylase
MSQTVALVLLLLLVPAWGFHTVHPLEHNITAMVIAGVHARERITTHVASMLRSRARRFQGPGKLVIVPEVVPASNSCWRGNPNGVDINRNFPVHWRESDPNSSFLDYGGPKALSEPESLELWKLLDQYRPDVVIDLHSGEVAVYTPWNSKIFAPRLLVKAQDVVDAVAPLLDDAKAGSGGQKGGYLAYGTFADTAFEEFGASCVFTFEVYGDQTESDCRKAFNPPGHQWHQIAQDWNTIIDKTIKLCSDRLG